MIMRTTLLSNATVTGLAQTIQWPGEYLFRASGTFGGATISLQQQAPDGVTWLSITDGSMIVPGSFVVFLGGEVAVRALVAGGAPSALFATLDRVVG